jgi:hypothetical protein
MLVFKQWKGINHKQSTRWQHLSRLKASAFFSLQKNSCYKTQQLILGTGIAIWWLTVPHCLHFLKRAVPLPKPFLGCYIKKMIFITTAAFLRYHRKNRFSSRTGDRQDNKSKAIQSSSRDRGQFHKTLTAVVF